MSSGCAHVHAATRLCGGGSAAAQLGESAVARSGRLPWDTSSVRLPWHTSSLPWHTSSREGRGGARQEMNLLLLHRRVPSGCGSPTWLALPRHYAELHRPTIGRAGGEGDESLGCVRGLDVRHVFEEASGINRPPTPQTPRGRGPLRYWR